MRGSAAGGWPAALGRRFQGAGLRRAGALLGLCLCALGACAAPAAPGPRVVVVVVEGLAADDLATPGYPHLTALARSGRVALMNTAVAGARTPTAATLALALGAREPADAADDQVYAAREVVEGATADVVYRRRMGREPLSGQPQGVAALLNLGLASLVRRDLAGRTVGAQAPGKLLFATDALPREPGRAAALLTLDRFGVGQGIVVPPGPPAPAALAAWVNARPESVVVRLRDRRALEPLLAALRPAGARLLVLSSSPPPSADGRWHRLTLAALNGPGVGTGLLTSATTRTPGLVANIDVAPTLLGWLGATAPVGIAGHPFEPAASPDPLRQALRLNGAVRTNALVEDPLYIGLGAVAVVVALGGLGALLWRPRAAPGFAFCLLCLMNMPVAMLLAAGACFQPLYLTEGLPPAGQAALYVGTIAAAMLVCGTAEMLLRRRLPPPAGIGLLTCGVIAVDALFGQPLVKFALLSSYQIPGIRFYGIGNEYAGVVISSALLAAFLARATPTVGGLGFAAMAVVLGFPRLGANAGGLIAAVVAFGTAWWVLRGRRARWPAAVAAALVGVALAFALALVDRSLAGGEASHMGGALAAAGSQGWGYLARIALRKELMNLRIVVHPGMVAAYLAVGSVVLVSGGTMRRRLADLAAGRPGWVRGLAPAGWGALAAFLFNDSGIVAAAFIVGTFVAAGLWLLLTSPAPADSAPSA